MEPASRTIFIRIQTGVPVWKGGQVGHNAIPLTLLSQSLASISEALEASRVPCSPRRASPEARKNWRA